MHKTLYFRCLCVNSFSLFGGKEFLIFAYPGQDSFNPVLGLTFRLRCIDESLILSQCKGVLLKKYPGWERAKCLPDSTNGVKGSCSEHQKPTARTGASYKRAYRLIVCKSINCILSEQYVSYWKDKSGWSPGFFEWWNQMFLST